VLTDQALLATRNGGVSWVEVASGALVDGVSDVFVDSATRVVLFGVKQDSPEMLVVLSTRDGGASWKEGEVDASALAPGRAYVSARGQFLDEDKGWLMGRVGTSSAFSVAELLRTTDAGASWQRLPPPPAAGRFVFVDSLHGFMAGAPVSERLYRTVDGGLSWVELEFPFEDAKGLFLDLVVLEAESFALTNEEDLADVVRSLGEDLLMTPGFVHFARGAQVHDSSVRSDVDFCLGKEKREAF